MTTQPTIGARDLIAFVCELAMLVLLVAAGHGMASGWRGWALGVFLAFVAIGIWSQWMAPTSARRLDNPQRFVAQVMLFATTACTPRRVAWPGGASASPSWRSRPSPHASARISENRRASALARDSVIAMAEPTIRVETREELIYLLAEATAVEHSIFFGVVTCTRRGASSARRKTG